MVNFSIVIPTLNEEKYLPILLASLASQTNKNFEVIIIDGKSEDRTKEKVMEFKEKLDIEIYEVNKRYVCYQRNFGAKKAKGEYLIFFDADHWIDNNFMDLAYKSIVKSNAEVVVPADYYAKKMFWRIYSAISVIFVHTSYALFKKPLCIGPTVIIKKNTFEKIGGYDETIVYLEEPYLLQLAYNAGARINYPRELKADCSTRRMDKAGALRFLYMHVVASFHYLFKGPIRKKLFEYKMGGQAHKITS